MSSCDNSNIRKNYIVTSTEVDILSACTGFYTNDIYPCVGDTITIHSDTLSANTINASVYLSGGTNILDIITDDNTFVTGFSYNNNNILNIGRNDGVSFDVNITEFSGITVNGVLSACTGIYTSNIYGCSPITIQDQLILSAVTNNDSLEKILVIDNNGLVEYRDVNSIITGTTTFVTGTTFSSNQAILSRNDGFEVLKLSGSSNVTLTNPSTNQIVIDASGVKYFISETTPTGVTVGNGYRWFNTSIGSEFVYIDDGDSSQWVQPLIQPGPQGPRGYTGTFLTTGITTSTSVLTTDYTYYGVNYIGDVDLTLPDPTGIDGINIMIKDEGGNASFNRIRLIASVGLIDGNSSIDMVNNYQSTYIVARNNNWWII